MGATQDKFVFRQNEPHIFIHTLIIFVYIQGALRTGGISGVFLVNLKIGLMHYEKPYTCINQMQHLHACSSLMFWPLMVWISIPESMHYFNQFVYAGFAAKSVKPNPVWNVIGPFSRSELSVSVLKSESQSFYLTLFSIHIFGNIFGK